MSISRRTATALRTFGVASAAAAITLGVAGSAFACVPKDFAPSVSCDTATGHADIKIVNIDPYHTGATITVLDNGQTVGTGDYPAGWTGQSTTLDIQVPWKTSGSWTLHVQAADKGPHFDLAPLDSPGGTCAVPVTVSPTPSPTKSKSASPSPSASKSKSTSPSPSASHSASPSASTPVSASPSTPVLATTGGGSSSGAIAGIAGALVLIGGGAVFALRRRGAAGRH